MARLDDGRHVAGPMRARGGRLLLGKPARPARVGRMRAVWWRIAAPAVETGMAGRAGGCSLRFAARAVFAGGDLQPAWGGRLRLVVRAAETGAAWGGQSGRALWLHDKPRGPALSALRALRGPGQSAGDFVVPLPAVWLAQSYPDAFIGRDLAALAVLRGESWDLAAGRLAVGGRVVIDEAGADIHFEDAADLDGWMDDRVGELARYLGVLGLPAGARRDRLVSRYRALAARAVRDGAKLARGVGDPARRAAMVADLAWVEMRM